MASADVAVYIGRWRPSSVSPEAAAFARDVITQTGPEGRERAKNLLWAAGKLADYALGLGLDLVPEIVLHPSAAERFTRCAPGLSGPARRTLRTNLRFIGRRVVPQLYPADLPLPRERSKKPYSPAEIGGYLALAGAQPTVGRRMHAAGLVCLGAGAGLIRGDLRDVRGTDVACRSGGVIVTVRGARPRTVPVLSRYHAPLLAAARFAGRGLVCGGAGSGRPGEQGRDRRRCLVQARWPAGRDQPGDSGLELRVSEFACADLRHGQSEDRDGRGALAGRYPQQTLRCARWRADHVPGDPVRLHRHRDVPGPLRVVRPPVAG